MKTAGTDGVPSPAFSVGGAPGRSFTSTTAAAPAAAAFETLRLASQVPRSISATLATEASKLAKLEASQPEPAGVPVAPAGPSGIVSVPLTTAVGKGAHVWG